MTGLAILLNIAGAVALLVWSARMLRTGMQRAYGAPLRRVISSATRNRLFAVGSGVLVALSLQSSAATALVALSFVTGGLLGTGAGLAMMLGADLGSALAVRVLALDVQWLAPVLLLVGVVTFLATERRVVQQSGRMLVGLGLLFLSLGLIGDAGRALAGGSGFTAMLDPIRDEPVLVFLLAGAAAWLVHSSVAMVLLVASLAGVGVLNLGTAFAMVLGANAGAGLVPVVLTLRRERAVQRIPAGNLFFRVAGAAAGLVALPYLLPYAGYLGDGALLQVVHLHVLFNMALLVLFLPLCGLVGRAADRLMVERADPSAAINPLDNPSHLDERAIDRPQVALACATREVLNMADWVEAMLRRSLAALRTDDREVIARLADMDDRIDDMHLAIKYYLIAVSRKELNQEEGARCMEISAFSVKLEHIGDIVQKNLLDVAGKRLVAGQKFSDAGWKELTNLHARVINNLQLALNTFVSGDLETARQLVLEKERSRSLEHESAERHLERLRTGSRDSLDSSPVHLDVIRDLAQINSILASTAYPILENHGELHSSRLRRNAAYSPGDQASDSDPVGDRPVTTPAP